MHSNDRKIERSDEPTSSEQPLQLGRRSLMKLGAGAAVTMLVGTAPPAQAQEEKSLRADAPEIGLNTFTGIGWTNNANRASGNGPMDVTSRQIVSYVNSFSAAQLSDPVIQALNRTMVDSIAALIAGFESEPVRISARLARLTQSDLKCTVLGYGITTSPEMAAFANGAMLRHTDFNDHGPGWHNSDIISGILAVAESLHSTGLEFLTAMALGYEIMGAFKAAFRGFGWDAPCEGLATAMGAGKLMGLNEDQLANALAIALVPHMPMEATHVGALSHWKGCHSAEATKNGVWAALLTRAGMTGPCQPFEARTGLFDHTGPFKNFQLPAPSPDGRLVIERMGFKRFPAEGNSQATLELFPQIREWTKVEEIEFIHHHMPFHPWQEIADPPKWDPRNAETADHSMPYLIARGLIDGEIYLNSYTPEKIMDPAVRALMAKITVRPVDEWSGLGPSRITIRKKTGEEKSWDSLDGERHSKPGHFATRMTSEEIHSKFNRAADFMSINEHQRDKARKQWADLRTIEDIAIPMRTLANFGKPKAL